jgi:hypothetical protein
MGNACMIFSEDLKESDYLEELSLDGELVFKLILKKQGLGIRIGFKWLRFRTRRKGFVNTEMNFWFPCVRMNFLRS